jgi:predicted PurR-regulated permease PerM
MNTNPLHDRVFLLLLAIVTVAFFWILAPFAGAVFWGAITAIMFAPINRWILVRVGPRPSLAALLTLLLVLVMVILPMMAITGGLVQEGGALYQRLRSGEINIGAFLQHAFDGLPPWIHELLVRYGLPDLASIQERLSEGALQASQFIASQAVNIGQNTFQFVISFGVMLYLMFFLLRDGSGLSRRIRQAIPLSESHKIHLLQKFMAVVRATVKGNVFVAITQGLLGGLIFWILGIQGVLLWTVLMAFLSLLPAIGAGLVWGPVAIYFLVTGSLWQGLVLIAYGVVVIGLVDNILRPILVGKDTRMPDWVILISTLGGMALFGISGFVIGPLVAALFVSAWDLFASSDNNPSR